MNNLLYRRQFILCNKEINADPEWKQIKLGKNQGNFLLHIHPDLGFTQVINDRFELILLGYIIDPYEPDSSDSDILDKLALFHSFEEILTGTIALSGRFAIIYNDKDSVKVFHDATGLREIYYFHGNEAVAVGSSASILADFLKIQMDEEKEITKFYNSPELNNVERRWIGNRTIYKDVFHLLPNHFLDLIPGKTKRFWPTVAQKKTKLKDAAGIIAGILKGTFEAADHRFTLHQGLTGGWDTRVLLAAAQKYLDSIHFYFIRGFKTDASLGNSGDYTISKAIAEKCHFPLEIVLLNNDEIDPGFKKAYFQNNHLARPKLLAAYYDAFKKKLENTTTVAGTSGNEILRLLSSIDRNVEDGDKIAGLMGYSKHQYAVDSINEWLEECMPLKKLNYNLLDLFNWEQLFSNWGSLSTSEQDIVREELRPFNNRLLMSTYISLNDKYRYRDYPLGHIEVIKLLWPELLEFDVDIRNAAFKKFLRLLKMEIFTDKIYQRVKRLIK